MKTTGTRTEYRIGAGDIIREARRQNQAAGADDQWRDNRAGIKHYHIVYADGGQAATIAPSIPRAVAFILAGDPGREIISIKQVSPRQAVEIWRNQAGDPAK